MSWKGYRNPIWKIYENNEFVEKWMGKPISVIHGQL